MRENIVWEEEYQNYEQRRTKRKVIEYSKQENQQ